MLLCARSGVPVTPDCLRLAIELTVVTSIWFEIDHVDASGVSPRFAPYATLTRFAHTVGGAQIDEIYASRT